MKRILLLLLCLVLLLGACASTDTGKQSVASQTGGDAASSARPEPEPTAEAPAEPDEPLPTEPTEPLPEQAEVFDGWTICWYLCGSNLESWYGCASADLAEMQTVALPENVRVVIQTGGAYEWHSDDFRDGVLQRHIYDADGLHLVEEIPEDNMGDAGTLTDFLSYCRTSYPSSRNALIFWNHGGGSVSGAVFDEIYGYDALTLDEFAAAIDAVCGASEEPPFDLIGFDTCLMASVDVANTFRSAGRYLVASEEVEPGCGWNYCGFLQALADDPSIDGAALGRAICDSYLEACTDAWVEGEITLSLTDLTRLQPLLDAYNDFGDAALLRTLDEPEFYTAFGRAAVACENYGGNTPEEGYTNMVDLGHLARSCTELLPGSADAVLSALEDCVLYRVSGPFRAEATGLSCYYSLNGDPDDFVGYTAVGASEAFKYLYAYGLTGHLSSTGVDYVSRLEPKRPPEEPTRQVPVLEDFDLSAGLTAYVDGDGYPTLQLEPALTAALREVRVRIRQAFLVSEEPLRMDIVAWGESDLAGRDWENGTFRAWFDGCWASLDGAALYLEVVYASDDYTLYSSPVLLNGELRNLLIAYEQTRTALPGGATQTDFDWHILGARESIDAETGMADKNLTLLQPGDEVIPVYLVMQDAGAEDAAWQRFYQPENAVIYADDSQLDLLTDFGRAVYDIEFELVDSRNRKSCSPRFVVDVTPWDVTVQLRDDYMAGLDTAVTRYR